MRRIRVIPVLLLAENGLVKTVRFNERKYVGDPINSVRIFNDKEVDELVILDIDACRELKAPNIDKIANIASECFMPVAYGGGVQNIDQVRQIFNTGIEKIIFNTTFFSDPGLVKKAASIYGSQSVVVSIDIKKRRLFGGYRVLSKGGQRKQSVTPVQAAMEAVECGAGEIFVNNIDRDGTMEGYDVDIVRAIADAVPVPVVACGGAGTIRDFVTVIQEGHASAVAAGSLFVFKGPHKAVLINYPDQTTLKDSVYSQI